MLAPPGELAPPPRGNPGSATDRGLDLSKNNNTSVNADARCEHSLNTVKIVYRSGTVDLNTVNSKFHLIRSFFEIFARFLSFHV